MKENIFMLTDRIANLQKEINEIASLPIEVKHARYDFVVIRKIFENTRGYILQIADQINLCYENTCYDACAVMVRRLIEILIIEAYDSINAENEICDSDGNYFYLEQLINVITSSSHWKLGRNTKGSLKKLKTIGDQSAHSRRYNAKRPYIDDLKNDIRVVTEELLYISDLRK